MGFYKRDINMSDHMMNDKAAVRYAREALRDVEELAGNAAFQRYLEKLRTRAEAWAESLLGDDSLEATEREALRQRRKGLLEALGFPEVERVAQERVLRACGEEVENEK